MAPGAGGTGGEDGGRLDRKGGGFVAAMWLFIGLGQLVWWLPGCASVPLLPGIEETAPRVSEVGGELAPYVREVVADWDDLEAAIRSGEGEAELVVADKFGMHGPITKLGPMTWVYDVLTVGGERGTLVAAGRPRRPGEGGNLPGKEVIVLRCDLGYPGQNSSRREVLFLNSIVDRLRELRGVDWAPPKD